MAFTLSRSQPSEYLNTDVRFGSMFETGHSTTIIKASNE